MSNYLQPHGVQHARLPSPSPTHRSCSNSSTSSRWCHPTTSSSAAPFCSHFQSFPASQPLPMSWLFASGDQIIGTSASASVISMNIQGWISLILTGFDLLSVQGTLKSLLQHYISKTSILQCSAFLTVQLSHVQASLVAQLVKNLPWMRETWVQSIGWEDSLEKETAIRPFQCSGLENSIDCIVCGVVKSQTRLSVFTFTFSHLYMTTGKP